MARMTDRVHVKPWVDFRLIGQANGDGPERDEFSAEDHRHLHMAEALAHLGDAARHLRLLVQHADRDRGEGRRLAPLLPRLLALTGELAAEWEREAES